jgi:hypothetical protein
MNRSITKFITAFVVSFACSADCVAGPWGKAIREGIEAVAKRSGKAGREGAEAAAEKSAGRMSANAGREGLEHGGALVVRTGDDLAGPIVGKFGDDGARAMRALSPEGAERLATMSDELAAGGRGGDWMRLIADQGDIVTDWLWERRGSVAVGTVATAVLLQPEEFLQASERIATTTINAAGQHIAGPIVKSAASGIPWALLLTVVIGGGALWVLAKVQMAALRRRLFVHGIELLTSSGGNGRRPQGAGDVVKEM